MLELICLLGSSKDRTHVGSYLSTPFSCIIRYIMCRCLSTVLCFSSASLVEILFTLHSDIYQVSPSSIGIWLNSRMPRSLSLPEFPVSLDIFCQSAWLAFLTASLWECANVFFDAFIAKVRSFSGKSYV